MRRLSLPLVVSVAALLPATGARADDYVASVPRDIPIAAYGGVVAWSDYDASARRYRLQLSAAGGSVAAPIRSNRQPFDVSLGPDARGSTVALYTRCTRSNGTKGCDVYRYDVRGRREARVRAVSSPRVDEAWPVQWHKHLAFIRRRPTGGGGRGAFAHCDLIYGKRLGARAPSRRLPRGTCAFTTGLSMRGKRIIQVTEGNAGQSETVETQVRRLSVRGGKVKVLARTRYSEEPHSFFAPSQSMSGIWLTHIGVFRPASFVHIEPRSGRRREVRAHANLTGSFARDERGRFYYLESPAGENCMDAGPVPCRLASAATSPFASRPRTLLPELTISAPSRPPSTGPYVLSGRLTVTVVRRGTVARKDPIAGVPIELLRRVEDPALPAPHETFRPTGALAVTGADGRWSYALPAPPPSQALSAVTRASGLAPTYAGRGADDER